jgi:predicted ATPase
MAAGWEAISEAKRIEHFNSIAYSLCFVSLLIMLRRDIATLKKTAGELLQVANQYRASYWALWAKPMLGWIAALEGNIEAGIRQMHESTVELQKQEANLWVPQTLLLEAEIVGNARQHERAYELLDDAQALIEPLDQRFYEAELHRVRGAVMLSENPDSDAGAASLDRAIDVARRQNSHFLELRACVSKARLLRDRGLRNEARDIVAPVYHSFSEGHDTVDLSEARALLNELD